MALVLAVIGLAAYANWPAPKLSGDVRADRVVIEKAARRLTLYRDGVRLEEYRVSLGLHPVGAKEREGDNRTPEGLYTIDGHKPDSSFHLALHVSYPEPRDRERAARLGVPPGGDIMVHGLPNGLGWLGRLQRAADWTAGCIALTNPEIEEIYRSVPDGTPIEIRP